MPRRNINNQSRVQARLCKKLISYKCLEVPCNHNQVFLFLRYGVWITRLATRFSVWGLVLSTRGLVLSMLASYVGRERG